MKLDNYDLQVLDEAQDLLETDIGVTKYPSGGGWVERDKLISMIEEFIYNCKKKKKKQQMIIQMKKEIEKGRY